MSREKLKKLLDGVFGEESGQAAAGRPFTELKCWDSLHYVQLVVATQDVFGIELSREQILRITTFGGMREALKEHGIATS